MGTSLAQTGWAARLGNRRTVPTGPVRSEGEEKRSYEWNLEIV